MTREKSFGNNVAKRAQEIAGPVGFPAKTWQKGEERTERAHGFSDYLRRRGFCALNRFLRFQQGTRTDFIFSGFNWNMRGGNRHRKDGGWEFGLGHQRGAEKSGGLKFRVSPGRRDRRGHIRGGTHGGHPR